MSTRLYRAVRGSLDRLALCEQDQPSSSTATLGQHGQLFRQFDVKLPSIVITKRDADRLDSLLDSPRGQAFSGRVQLETELTRASIVRSEDIPPNVVTMNSTVAFRTGDGKEFSLKLVYPKDSDDSSEKLSILAPVGSAILGLKEGDSISSPILGGASVEVETIRVVDQPERDGNYALLRLPLVARSSGRRCGVDLLRHYLSEQCPPLS